MYIDPAFHDAVAKLLGKLGLNGKEAIADKQEVYSVDLDGRVQISLIGSQEGFVTLMCFVGALPEEATKESLLALLQVNLFSYEVPPLSVGVDSANSGVVLWSRVALLDANEEVFVQLFRRVVQTADAIREWLNRGAPAKMLIQQNTKQDGAAFPLPGHKAV